MKHIALNGEAPYKVAILIKEAALTEDSLKAYYVNNPQSTIEESVSVIALSLAYNDKNKAPSPLVKNYTDDLLNTIKTLGVETLLVADSTYFKYLTKVGKVEPHHGSIKSCRIEGYEYLSVILSVNYQALFYNPAIQSKLDLSLKTLTQYIKGTFEALGTDVIHSAEYPETIASIDACLQKLHNYPALTCDTETFSLHIAHAGLGTIGFAWDQHNGIAFAVEKDTQPNEAKTIRKLLLNFFNTYKGTLIFHGSTFDIKVLVRALYMESLEDVAGMHKGVDTLCSNFHCTKVITYLATNTTAGNKLGLKEIALEFAGNYAQTDINDITLIPKKDLLEYNLVDCLSTWYAYNKYHPVMLQDDQLSVYETIMHPSVPVIVEMELTGMPMDMAQIKKTNTELLAIQDHYLGYLHNNQIIKDYEWQMQCAAMVAKNATLKKKVKPIEDFECKYNPGSANQTQNLLYEVLGLPVTDKTAKGAPSVKGKVLKKLLNTLVMEYDITDEELAI